MHSAERMASFSMHLTTITNLPLRMLRLFALLLNIFAPIIQPMGVLGLCGCVIDEAYTALYWAGALTVVGLVFGILACRLDIPPRWFWAKSSNELFRFKIVAVLGYMWSLAAWPPAVYFVRQVLGPMLSELS